MRRALVVLGLLAFASSAFAQSDRASLSGRLGSLEAFNSPRELHLMEDFFLCNTATHGFTSVVSGAVVGIFAFPQTFGVCGHNTQTGTTSTGGYTQQGGYTFGQGSTLTAEARIRLSHLSDGTNTFTAYSGFNDYTPEGGTDAVGFRYTHSANGGRWLCYTRNNTAETTADSGVAVAASTWYVMTVSVSPEAAPVATFSINGAPVCSISTNIPTVTTNDPATLARESVYTPERIVKSAGANPRFIYIDYARMDVSPVVR